jgi:Polyglycine hydrolase-like, structural repeat
MLGFFTMDTTGKRGRGGKRLLSYSVRLLKTTFNHWLEDKAPQLGAALAYYNGQARFASIWEKREGPPFRARFNLNSALYQQTFDQLLSQGFLPTQVSGYGTHS